MTIEEALKVIDLNIDKLNGSMQMAVRTLLQDKTIYEEGFTAGLKWRQEQPSEDLEKAAEGYMQQVDARFLRTLEHPTAKDCFKAGAEWQKEQMLKGAVEGEVMMNALHPHEPRVTASYPNCPYKFGDKVKIVIVKEEKV